MRERLFKSIFCASFGLCLVSLIVLTVSLIRSVPELRLLELFTPLLCALMMAAVLAVGIARGISRSVTDPLDKIDFSRPDERDVEAEIKPLVRRLNDQNRQIRSQMAALEQEHEKQDRMRREFTANVSHELKTPLTSISGFAELMRDGLVRPEDVQRFAGKIHEEAQRLIILVGDIIRLSRLEDSQMTVDKEPVSLYQTAEWVLQQLEPMAQKQNITMELTGSEGWVKASSQITEEILYNLCDNAVKYNRAGGSVRVAISEEENRITVCVSDTGIGIPKEDQPRIFERFYRVDKSHSKEVGGTGLGLSIVKHGAARLGATIQMESTLGKGTTVSLTFSNQQEECQ